MGLCLVMFFLVAAVRTHDIREADEERKQFLQRWLPSVKEQIQRDENIQVENTRSVSPLSVLSVGLEPVVPFRFSSTKEGLRFGASRASGNTADTLFGYLDSTFVVTTLMSLIAIILTFDAVSGERVQGTLPLLLSYPVSRTSFVAAKATANAIVLGCCFVPSFILLICYAMVTGLPLLHWGHWVAYAGLAALYLLVFTMAGVAASAHSGSSSDSAVRAVVIWFLFVFIIPRAMSLVVALFLPSADAAYFAIREDQQVSKLRVEHSSRMRKLFEAYMANADREATRDETFGTGRQRALRELSENRRAVVDRLRDEQEQRHHLRQKWTRVLSALSPTSTFIRSAAELSWTGEIQRTHFVAQARAYDENVGRRLAESRQAFYARTGVDTSAALVTFQEIRPFLIPFSPTLADSNRVFRSYVFDVLTLLAYISIFAAYAVVSTRSLDVRF